MSTISDVRRRFARAANIDFSNVKLLANKGKTTRSLASSIDSVEDPSARKRLKELQRDAAASGGTFTQLERDMINRLIKAVKDGGNLDLALAAEVIDVVSDLSKTSARGELYENQRDIAFLLLDAIGSKKYDKKDLKPIIDEFRKLSTDDDGFTEKDAQRIRDLLRNLDMLDEAADGGKRPGGSYKDIDDFADSQPGKPVPGKRVPGKLDLGDIELPKDGVKGRGGAGGKDGEDEGGKDTKGKDTDGSDSKGKGAADGKGNNGADGKGKDDDRGDDTTKPDLPTLIGVGEAIDIIAGAGDEAKDKDKDKDKRGADGKDEDDKRGADDKGKDDKRGADDKGKDDKRGADDKGKDDKRGADDKGKDDKRGADDKGKDDKRGADDKGKDDKGEGSFVRPDKPPTDINLPDKDKTVDVGGFKPTKIPEDDVKPEPDDVDETGEAGGSGKTEDPAKTEGPDKDGRSVVGRGSVSAAAVILRTPHPPVMEESTPAKLASRKTGKTITLSGVNGVSVFHFQFRLNPDTGKYDLLQKAPGTPWVVVSSGWSANAKVQYGPTTELTAGGIGSVGFGNANKDDLVSGSGAAAYGQHKWIDTIRVQEQGWDRNKGGSTLNRAKDAQRQFRVRVIQQVTVQAGFRTDGGQEDPTFNGIGDIRVEYRWGRTSRTPTPDGKDWADKKNDKGKSIGIPPSDVQHEWGVGFGIGAGINIAAVIEAGQDKDWTKLKQIGAALPRAALTFQWWSTGLNGIKAWANKNYRDKQEKGGAFAKALTTAFRVFGQTFQSWVLSVFATATLRGNNPNTPVDADTGLTAVTVANKINTPGSVNEDGASDGLPSEDELLDMADGVMDDVKGLFAWLEKSGLADLAKMAQPLIELASLAPAAKKLFSKKGLIDFTLDKLNPQQRGRMTDSILARAFELAAAEMGKTPDMKTGKGLDPRNSFMKLPGESAAEYGERVIKLVLKQVPKAAAEILSSDFDFDEILVGPDLTGPAKAAAVAAAIALLNGEDDENEDDNGGKKDNTGKDADEPTATDGPGGSRNAALNAVHEADEAQGDRLPVTVEAEASIYITPKLAADPVYMAAYVARLAHDQDDVATARKYAAAMSDLGYSKDAARVLAPLLTNAEIADPAFMKTLDAALVGIKRQPSDVGGVIYETQVKAALEALRGKQPATPSQVRGALEALRGKQPADPSAEPTDPSVEPTDEDPASRESPRELADRVIRLGSENGVWVNRSELEKGLDAAGLEVKATDEAWERVISTYGAAGTGVLTAAELADAMEDGVIKITQDGAVTVDARALQEQQRPNSQNVALRVITSLGIDALTTVAQLREGFRNAGYELTATDAQLEEFLRLFNHGQGIDHNALTGAIAVAALKIVGADGRVTVDQAVLDLLKPPPRRPGSIEDPGVGQAGPGSIVIDGEPA